MRKPFVGKRFASLSDDFSVRELKKCAKLHKCTITEACYSLIGQSMREYSEIHGDKDLREITILSSFSTRPTPTSKKEITLGNGFIPMPITFPVDKDFKRALEKN